MAAEVQTSRGWERRKAHLPAGLLASIALIGAAVKLTSGGSSSRETTPAKIESVSQLMRVDYAKVQAYGRQIMHFGKINGLTIRVTPGTPPIPGENQVYQFSVQSPNGSVFEALGPVGGEPIGTAVIPASGQSQRESLTRIGETDTYIFIHPSNNSVEKVTGNEAIHYTGSYSQIDNQYVADGYPMVAGEIKYHADAYLHLVQDIVGGNQDA